MVGVRSASSLFLTVLLAAALSSQTAGFFLRTTRATPYRGTSRANGDPRWQLCSLASASASAPVVRVGASAVVALRLGNGRDDGHDNDDSYDARTDVNDLLTQRAIQSFMYLLNECRDPHSGKWLEDFLGMSNQLEYHGTGAGYLERFGGGNNVLLRMLEQPKDVVVVSAKRRGRGHGGWSKDNPYLEERFVEFEIDIDPVSLASRILSVKEQIAQEWAIDLDVLRDANDQILESYFAKVKGSREGAEGEAMAAGGGGERGEKEVAFERTAAIVVQNIKESQVGSSSPFRDGNFDLLYNLCTQASIHRLLRDLRDAGEDKAVSYQWLRDFYAERVAEYFDGDQKYGRADDFLEALLLTPPSIVQSGDGGGRVGLADPLLLAERIIEKRSGVAGEWKEIMLRVPQDHADIRRALLTKQMQAWNSGPSTGGFE